MPEFASLQKMPKTRPSTSGLLRNSKAQNASSSIAPASIFDRNLNRMPTTANGPQSFTRMPPGKQVIDPGLVKQNREVEKQLFHIADGYYKQKDLRWMFAYAHATITKQINRSLTSFQRPNELLQLNMHFGTEWIRAASGTPHESWRQAFRFCHATQFAFLPLDAEICAARMADVHIRIDLANALADIGCIPPADYGNMLALVERGNQAAIEQLHSRVVGKGVSFLQSYVAPMLGLDVEAWRNAVYRLACNVDVPPVEIGFDPDKMSKQTSK